MSTNTDELKRLAEGATSGPWDVVEDETYCGGFGCTPDGCHGHPTGRGTWVDGPQIIECFEGAGILLGEDLTDDEQAKLDKDAYDRAAADAAYIAAANPSAILSLIEEVEGLRGDERRLDWLDHVNERTNERNGTTYGWKYDINHNRASLNDSSFPAYDVRKAIDQAMGAEVTYFSPRCTKAKIANELSDLKAENATLRAELDKALEVIGPFAADGRRIPASGQDEVPYEAGCDDDACPIYSLFNVGDLRRAAAFTERHKSQGESDE